MTFLSSGQIKTKIKKQEKKKKTTELKFYQEETNDNKQQSLLQKEEGFLTKQKSMQIRGSMSPTQLYSQNRNWQSYGTENLNNKIFCVMLIEFLPLSKASRPPFPSNEGKK